MDDIPTQDAIPIHFPQFQPTSSQTQLDNNGQPLPPQLRNTDNQNSQNMTTFTNFSQLNLLRAELDSPQITISSDNTNSNDAQQGSSTDTIDDKPDDTTIEEHHPTSPTTATESQEHFFQMQKRNKSVKFRTRHVHFNKQIESFEIPRNVCTFRHLLSTTKKRIS